MTTFQTLTKKKSEEELSTDETVEKLGDIIKKYYPIEKFAGREIEDRGNEKWGEIPNVGGIYFHLNTRKVNFFGILAEGAIFYLGIKEGKKFKKMIFDIKHSLTDNYDIFTGQYTKRPKKK